ncbi:MAG: PqqD family protein [Acidobacteriota bacterium]|jgi:hypothetical protein
MDQDRKPAPARDVAAFLSAPETVLFKESTQAFCRLNETASIIWDVLEQGHDEARIAADLTENHGVSRSVADDYVRSTLCDLGARGFLADPDELSAPPRDAPQAGPDLAAWRTPIPRLKQHLLLEVRELRIEVSADDRRCTNLLEQVFGFLLARDESTQARATIGISIHTSPADRYTVHYGATTVPDCRLDQVPPLVHAAMARAYYDFNFRFLALHSAAVCAEGKLLLLPGGAGAGKSSLTAALLARGFGYVTDELLLVDLYAKTLTGAPLAIGLKPGAWQLVGAIYPGVASMPVFERQDGRRVKYLTPPGLCRNCALEHIGAVVFPSVTADVHLALHPLSVAETFSRFTEAGYDTGRRMTRRDISRVFDWIGAIPAYELCYRNLDDAVRAIKGLSMS